MNETDINSNFEYSCDDHSVAQMNQQNKGNPSEKMDQQEVDQQRKNDSIQNLPGQVQSFSSSSTDFDVETFRNTNTMQRGNLQLSPQDQNVCNESSYLKFLGINFEIANLIERNKDPILFLKCVSLFTITGFLLNSVIFIVGLKFKILPTTLGVVLNIAGVIATIHMCKNSVKNGVKFQPFFLICAAFLGSSFLMLFIYCLLVQTPFQSKPIFLLLAFLSSLTACLIFSFTLVPNFTPHDDLNYQQNYFAPRIMASFFNAIGTVDALSDVVLGIELVQYSSKKLLIIGIFLIVLSNVDYMYALARIFTPSKVGLREIVATIIVEVVVLALTAAVLVDIAKISEENQKEETLFVTVISITTTAVNFFHNLMLVLQNYMCQKFSSAHKIVVFAI